MTSLPEAPAYTPLTDRKDGAQFFEADYRVRVDDVDQAMRVRLDAMARHMQDVGYDNIDASEFGFSDPFWIIRRSVIDVIRPISWPGTITAQRWCGSLSTRWTNMRIRLTSEHETNPFNPEARPPGLVETEGFLINVNDQGLPSRISDDMYEFLVAQTDEHRLRWKSMNPDKAPAADEVDLPDRVHTLRVTDFDPFKHLNNAAYLEAVEDELIDHPDLVDVPHRAVIEYLRPIVPGTEITIRRLREPDRLLLWMLIGDSDGALVVAASVSVSKLP